MSAAETKAGRIADTLRADIASGSIERGARLFQDELARRFETSITPVREALRILDAEGLVVGEAHRGVRVAAPNIDQIASIYIMRRLVEPYAACRASKRLSRREYDRARRLNEDFLYLGDSDPEKARSLNREFHFTFYNACGMPTLIAEIERLWTGFPWAALQVRRGLETVSYDEHAAFLEAVIADEQEQIRSLLETHVRHGFEALVSHIGITLPSDPFEDLEEEDDLATIGDGVQLWKQ